MGKDKEQTSAEDLSTCWGLSCHPMSPPIHFASPFLQMRTLKLREAKLLVQGDHLVNE